MREFKVGDVIKMKRYCSGAEAGKTYTLILDEDETLSTKVYNEHGGCSCRANWILVSAYKKEIKEFGIVKFMRSINE